MRRIGITISLVGAVALLVTAGAPAAKNVGGRRGHHPAGRVRSVSNPPATVPGRLRLKVGGANLTSVSVYASPVRAKAKGAARLAKQVRVRRGRIAVSVSSKLAPGSWFVVVCPASGGGACAASHKPMLKVPSRLSAPVQAQPVPETTRAATATIGSAGGTLDATAADGTRFHLDIPPKSVPDGTQITMTPLSSLTNASWAGRLVGAVQLAPEGLVLVHGGTLTVMPARPVPVRNQIALGYTGTGSDLHEVPLAPTTSALEIPLTHFSGAGASDAPADTTPPSTGSTILDFYFQLIADAIEQARDGQISEQEAFNEGRAWLQDALKDVMRDEVPPGLNDDDAATQAIRDLLSIAREDELLGGTPDSVFDEVKPTVYKLLEGMYKRAQQKCANHDLTQVKRIIDADRNEQLMGFPGHEVSQDVQCLRFRIDFDSAIDIIAGSGGSGSWHFEYVSHPTVQPDAQNGYLFESGSDFGSYAAASGTITGDDGTSVQVTSGQGDALDVVKLQLGVDPTDTTPPQLILDLHSPSEQYHAHDPSGPYDSDYTDHEWLNTFNDFHPPQSGWNVLQLERVPGNGDLVARGSFTNSTPDGSATEATTIDVFHTPPPPPS